MVLMNQLNIPIHRLHWLEKACTGLHKILSFLLELFYTLDMSMKQVLDEESGNWTVTLLKCIAQSNAFSVTRSVKVEICPNFETTKHSSGTSLQDYNMTWKYAQ